MTTKLVTLEPVLGWRQACDQRGLSEFDRSQCNFQMLTFLLEELMPWYKDTYDFRGGQKDSWATFCMASIFMNIINL